MVELLPNFDELDKEFLERTQAAASQPAVTRQAKPVHYATSPAEADAAIARFGTAARQAGWAHPEVAVSALELAEALGSPRLVILDIRPKERFEAGRLPRHHESPSRIGIRIDTS